MTEDKKKNKLSDAAATVIAAVIGLIGVLIGVGFFPFLNPNVQEMKDRNAELEMRLSQTIPAPKGSDEWEENGVKHRYWMCKGFPDWEEARAFCENLGGHLATITSSAEQAHIQEYVEANAPKAKTALWIGIQSNNGNWNQWIGGESLKYAHWGTGFPRFPKSFNYAGVVFSNYERLSVSFSSEERVFINRGEWLQVSQQFATETVNPLGWLICEWDYD